MLSVSIGVAGTYALFSDNVEVTNHLQAGTLELGLTRTKLVKSVPDATTGMPTKTEDATARDFSAATSENVFGIGDEKIAPGSWYEVEMHVINKGTVAFNYRVAIELDSATTAENLAFAEQLTVYVNVGFPLIAVIINTAMDALVSMNWLSGALMLAVCILVSILSGTTTFRLTKSAAVVERIQVE